MKAGALTEDTHRRSGSAVNRSPADLSPPGEALLNPPPADDTALPLGANLVPVIPALHSPAWNGDGDWDASACVLADISEAINEDYQDTAPLVPCYATVKDGAVVPCPRLSKNSPLPDSIEVVVLRLVFDIDSEMKSLNRPTTSEWRAAEAEKLRRLGWAWYATKNGYRIYVDLAKPISVGEYERIWPSVAAWLEDEHGIVVDHHAKDWTRLFYLPRITKNGEKLNLPIEGGTIHVLDLDTVPRLEHTPHRQPPGGKRLLQKARRRSGLTSKYGAAALRLEAAAVASAPAGERTSQLYRSACSVGELVAGGEVAAEAATASLLQAAAGCGLVDDDGEEECLRHIRNGLARGAESPRCAPPTVVVRPGEEARQVDEAVAAMCSSDPDLYQSGEDLVQLLCDPPRAGGSVNPRFQLLSENAIRYRVARCVRWVSEKRTEEGEIKQIPKNVPTRLPGMIGALGTWPGMRRARGIIQCPTIRPDGSLLMHPGYDAATELVFVDSGAAWPAIPDSPTVDQCLDALAILNEPIEEFPFESEIDRAVMLALMISAVIRPGLINECVPLFLLDATTRGSGKGFLAAVPSTMATGERHGVLPYGNDEEMRKLLTSILIEGRQIAVFDDVQDVLGCSYLDAVLTSPRWSDRKLKVNSTVNRDVNTLFIATGNNLRVKGDLARRAVRCRLAPEMERPELRNDFKIPNLMTWLKQNRSRLVSAALTIVRGYESAGTPPVDGVPIGTFEAWARRVRDPLVWLGAPDPVRSQEAVHESADLLTQAWKEVLGLIADEWGVNKDFETWRIAKAEEPTFGTGSGSVWWRVKQLILETTGNDGAHSIGAHLRKLEGRTLGGHSVVRRGRSWAVRVVGDPPRAGSGAG